LSETTPVPIERMLAAPRARRGRAPLVVVLPSVATAAAVSVPLLYIFIRATEGGLKRYLDLVVSRETFDLLARTILLVAGVVAVACAIALTLAWLVVRTDLPFRRAIGVAAALPLVFPSYIAAFALVAVAGPRGYLAEWLGASGGEGLPAVAYGYSGALLALAPFVYPYVYLLLLSALRSLDPALEESAQSLGASRRQAFVRVVLPQLLPALYSGSLLVTLYTLSDFGAVSIVRYNTFTLAIYNAYRASFDRTAAAAFATVLVVVTIACIAAEVLLVRGIRLPSGRATRQAQLVRLGRWRWPALGLVLVVFAVSLLVPVGTILHWLVRGGGAMGALPAGIAAGVASLGSSAAAAAVCSLLAIFPAVWAVRYPGRVARVVERITYSGYALPGIVIALALVFFITRYAYPLYQTFTLLVVAYVIRFLPEAMAAARSSLLTIAPVFEEVARTLGRGSAGVLREVTVPLLSRGLFAGAGLVFLTAMKELPATLILRPTGFETLATRVWATAAEGYYSEAAVHALILMTLSAVPVYLLVIRPVLADRSPTL
jgi:iron(III) transport system permease protein